MMKEAEEEEEFEVIAYGESSSEIKYSCTLEEMTIISEFAEAINEASNALSPKITIKDQNGLVFVDGLNQGDIE